MALAEVCQMGSCLCDLEAVSTNENSEHRDTAAFVKGQDVKGPLSRNRNKC